MSNRSSRIVPAVLPSTDAPAASPFRALLVASAGKVAASSRRTVNASGFPPVSSAEFPAAVLAACEAVMAGQSAPDAPKAMSLVAERLNKLGVRPMGKYITGAKYGPRSALAGTPMWQRDGVSLAVAEASSAE